MRFLFIFETLEAKLVVTAILVNYTIKNVEDTELRIEERCVHIRGTVR